jgi:transcription antitermination factor NusG
MTWFALQTLPQRERDAVTSLQRMLMNAQCPFIVERRIRHRRSATIEQEVRKPMFTGYILLECAYLPEWVYRERFVLRPLPTPIPEHLALSALARSGEITVDEWRRIQKFAEGDIIRRKGDASGLTMTVLSADDNNLVALSRLFGRENRVSMPVNTVEAAE